MTKIAPELLRGLPESQMEQALSLGSRITLPGASELFALGEAADRLYMIERGRVRLTLPMKIRGREEEILVEERTAGQAVGWSALIPPYLFTLRATTPDETTLMALSREALDALFSRYPQIGLTITLNLAALIGQRLQLFQAMWIREMQRNVELRHG